MMDRDPKVQQITFEPPDFFRRGDNVRFAPESGHSPVRWFAEKTGQKILSGGVAPVCTVKVRAWQGAEVHTGLCCHGAVKPDLLRASANLSH